ncbi:hypothetical protein GGI43DRAFT_414258, partial [Trichoderma evansii]
MVSYEEEHIILALKDVESGLSQRKAAERRGIPRSTLRHRPAGGQNAKEANEWRQRLSN